MRPTGASATLHLNVESGSGQPFPGGVLARQVLQHLAGFFLYAGLTEAVTSAPKSYRLEIRPVKSDFQPIAMFDIFKNDFRSSGLKMAATPGEIEEHTPEQHEPHAVPQCHPKDWATVRAPAA